MLRLPPTIVDFKFQGDLSVFVNNNCLYSEACLTNSAIGHNRLARVGYPQRRKATLWNVENLLPSTGEQWAP